VALVGFSAANWVCMQSAVPHVIFGHWGPSALVALVVFAIAASLRRRGN